MSLGFSSVVGLRSETDFPGNGVGDIFGDKSYVLSGHEPSKPNVQTQSNVDGEIMDIFSDRSAPLSAGAGHESILSEPTVQTQPNLFEPSNFDVNRNSGGTIETDRSNSILETAKAKVDSFIDGSQGMNEKPSVDHQNPTDQSDIFSNTTNFYHDEKIRNTKIADSGIQHEVKVKSDVQKLTEEITVKINASPLSQGIIKSDLNQNSKTVNDIPIKTGMNNKLSSFSHEAPTEKSPGRKGMAENEQKSKTEMINKNQQLSNIEYLRNDQQDASASGNQVPNANQQIPKDNFLTGNQPTDEQTNLQSSKKHIFNSDSQANGHTNQQPSQINIFSSGNQVTDRQTNQQPAQRDMFSLGNQANDGQTNQQPPQKNIFSLGNQANDGQTNQQLVQKDLFSLGNQANSNQQSSKKNMFHLGNQPTDVHTILQSSKKDIVSVGHQENDGQTIQQPTQKDIFNLDNQYNNGQLNQQPAQKNMFSFGHQANDGQTIQQQAQKDIFDLDNQANNGQINQLSSQKDMFALSNHANDGQKNQEPSHKDNFSWDNQATDGQANQLLAQEDTFRRGNRDALVQQKRINGFEAEMPKKESFVYRDESNDGRGIKTHLTAFSNPRNNPNVGDQGEPTHRQVTDDDNEPSKSLLDGQNNGSIGYEVDNLKNNAQSIWDQTQVGKTDLFGDYQVEENDQEVLGGDRDDQANEMTKQLANAEWQGKTDSHKSKGNRYDYDQSDYNVSEDDENDDTNDNNNDDQNYDFDDFGHPKPMLQTTIEKSTDEEQQKTEAGLSTMENYGHNLFGQRSHSFSHQAQYPIENSDDDDDVFKHILNGLSQEQTTPFSLYGTGRDDDDDETSDDFYHNPELDQNYQDDYYKIADIEDDDAFTDNDNNIDDDDDDDEEDDVEDEEDSDYKMEGVLAELLNKGKDQGEDTDNTNGDDHNYKFDNMVRGDNERIGKLSKHPTAPTNMVLFYTWMILTILIMGLAVSTYEAGCKGMLFGGGRQPGRSGEDRKRLLDHEFV